MESQGESEKRKCKLIRAEKTEHTLCTGCGAVAFNMGVWARDRWGDGAPKENKKT
jgi:hypothetical protein